MLKELVPAASRIAVFWNSKNEIHRANLPEELPQAADTLGVQLQMIDVREVAEVEAAFDAAVRGGPTPSSSWAIRSRSRQPRACRSARSGHAFPQSIFPVPWPWPEGW